MADILLDEMSSSGHARVMISCCGMKGVDVESFFWNLRPGRCLRSPLVKSLMALIYIIRTFAPTDRFPEIFKVVPVSGKAT